ncbi:pimeloyl-ACP methyl ester carboxylesterase [Variovorax paradoxus]|uniref:alpha/beta fold hydrolase n=1 Tax=Variovorax paradoxus TaxID=34073 RepID=UPI00278AFCFD|nr:alpha/beta hydrolase [Variovorax paradoxus]MDQ0023914.1 pimeloyl-ACP methyl ester carboxylesterase [Variovorax paradoxus]
MTERTFFTPSAPPHAASPLTGDSGAVKHRFTDVDGMRIFYREAGPVDAPVLLLPHGYPCSSFQYRRLMPALADQWRLVAPDYPGFGLSDTPPADTFGFDFDAYAGFLEAFCDKLALDRYALYLHDYGSQIGLRLAIRRPERVTAVIIQNGDIYEDTLGPKYRAIQEYWRDPSAKHRAVLEEAVSEDGFRAEFVGEVSAAQAPQIPPDLWKLHWPLMDTPPRRKLSLKLMEGLKKNLEWFPRYQAYLREHQPPALIVWGPNDGYMPEASARAYLRDLPKAELVLTDGGHWLLETHLEQVVPVIRRFLSAAHSR